MAHNDPDWLTFRDHERVLRRHLPSIKVTTGLLREWRQLCDARAYARCLDDITAARRRASVDYQEAKAIAGKKEEDPSLPWRRREIDAVYVSYQSQRHLFGTLQQFTAEQKRIRENGVSNADKTSRDWTKRLVRETQGRIEWIRALWKQVQASVRAAKAQGQEQTQSSTRGQPAQGSNVPATGAREEQSGEVHASAAGDNTEGDAPPRRPTSSRGRRKRVRQDDDDDDDDASAAGGGPAKFARIASKSTSPNIMRESITREQDVQDPQPIQTEGDLLQELDSDWMTFLEARNEQDRPVWEVLYHRARKLCQDAQVAEVPDEDDTSDVAREQMRIRINKALVDVIGWDWEEHTDSVKANIGNLYNAEELRHVQIMRDVSMQRAREGGSPEWPPPLREAAPSRPFIEKEAESQSESNDQIANDIANDIVFDGRKQESGRWTYLTSIGQGAQGEAGLWMSIMADDHGMVIDRIVVKSISLKDTYAKDSVWIQNKFTGGGKRYRELAMHAQLSAVGNSESIVRYRGATSKNERRWIQRIYMEYCPHGDLLDLLCRHAKFDQANRCDLLDDDDQLVPQVRIPVRALWAFFKDLAAAACVLERGYNPTDSRARAPSDWDEIIHRDLKPANVFLAAPLATTGLGIPVCKVGDFGITVPRDFEPLPNPTRMCGAGTPGWKAPEYHRYADSEDAHELSSATDVWAIGRIMLALIELTPGVSPKSLPDVRYDDDKEGQVTFSETRPALEVHYGSELYGLVEECLHPVPSKRITATKLLQTVKRQYNSLVRLPAELHEGDVLEYAREIRWAN